MVVVCLQNGRDYHDRDFNQLSCERVCDYPDRPLDRLTTFFRPILVIPIVIVYSLLNPSSETPLRPSDLVTDAHAQFFSYADYDSPYVPS